MCATRVWMTRTKPPTSYYLEGNCSIRLSYGQHAQESARRGSYGEIKSVLHLKPVPRQKTQNTCRLIQHCHPFLPVHYGEKQ